MSSPVKNSSPVDWTAVKPYVVPPIVAGLSIVPNAYGFVVKSALQREVAVPVMSWHEKLVTGAKLSPTIGVTVGVQLLAQKYFEKKLVGHDKEKQNSWSIKLASSALVGAASVVPLAVFNGQLAAKKDQKMLTVMWETVKQIRLRESIAIVARETSFVFSLSVSQPINEAMKTYLKDPKKVDYLTNRVTWPVRYVASPEHAEKAQKKVRMVLESQYPTLLISAGLSGFAGAVVNHAADSAFTRWQAKMSVNSPQELFYGLKPRAKAVARFSMTYALFECVLEKLSARMQDTEK